MIAASRSVQVGAVVAAILLHGALAMALMRDAEVEIEGGTGAPEARMGTSFADMAAGTLKANAATDVAQPVPVDAARQVAAPLTPEIAEQVQPIQRLAAERSPRADIAARAPVPRPALRIETLSPDVPTAQPILPEEVLLPDEADPAVSHSLRPKRRSAAFELAHERVKPAPPPKPEPKRPANAKPAPKVQPATRGNASQNAAAGAATGRAETKATASGSAGQTPQATGNAAASNYPGTVMRKISRVPRPRSTSRGTAVVAFTVAASGALGGVRIASSSGSAQLDRAALSMIQSAAPFPQPPPGAQRSFTINIKGR
ncbi:energy transducer TonB family protein [Roseovarius arcticus]|uniref:energy transducer TonB family protein n=1 Tax=Roseovarius arcticus TaxID=2547404 RepID=UPI0011105767|nr:energy transducer TonB [Roseovarius arcticus]